VPWICEGFTQVPGVWRFSEKPRWLLWELQCCSASSIKLSFLLKTRLNVYFYLARCNHCWGAVALANVFNRFPSTCSTQLAGRGALLLAHGSRPGPLRSQGLLFIFFGGCYFFQNCPTWCHFPLADTPAGLRLRSVTGSGRRRRGSQRGRAVSQDPVYSAFPAEEALG